MPALPHAPSDLLTLLDTVGLGAAVLDAAHNLRHANTRFSTLTGRDAPPIGMALADLLPDWHALRRTLPLEHHELCLPRPDGSMRWVALSAAPGRHDGAEPTTLVCLTDIHARKQMEENQRLVADILTRPFDSDFFVAVTRRLSETLGVDVALISECCHDASVRTIAFWQQGRRGKDKTYQLAGTPCQTVVGREPAFYQSQVRGLFPDDASLADDGVDSYAGVPLTDSAGMALGHIALMHTAPFPTRCSLLDTLNVVGARIASEMERNRREAELEDRNRRLREEMAARERAQSTVAYLRDELGAGLKGAFPVGHGPAYRALLENIRLVAQTDASVLVTGETGTGKELVARLIHEQSGRTQHTLVKVNCSALPPELIEAELFGHEKGAFTHAQAQRKGRFELADGGTLFLDEIGELSLSAQVKLLRVLQEKEFERVGGSKPIRVDFRLIAATNRDLEAMVRTGGFREDLFYRLNVFPIHVPPLRARGEDLPLLAEHFLTKYARGLGKRFSGFADGALEALRGHDWPGNIRELENLIHRSAIRSPGPLLELCSLPRFMPREGLALEDVARGHIEAVLAQVGGRVEGPGGAAELLGLHPSTLRSRLKKLGVGRADRRPV